MKGDRDKNKAWTYRQHTDWHNAQEEHWATTIQWGGDDFDEYPRGRSSKARDLDILVQENVTAETHLYRIRERHFVNGSFAKTHQLFRRGEGNELHHIDTAQGDLEWHPILSAEGLPLASRTDEDSWDPYRDSPESFNKCTDEDFKDPYDMKPSDPDVEDDDTDPFCNHC